MEITLLLNNPPGGRCRLYRAYAAALGVHASVPCTERFDAPPGQPELRAPAILVGGLPIAPADGVILMPREVALAIGNPHADVPRLEAILEEVMEQCMQEWEN
jgi:hypothetical protein